MSINNRAKRFQTSLKTLNLINSTSFIFLVINPEDNITKRLFKASTHILIKCLIYAVHVTSHIRGTFLYTSLWPSLLINLITQFIHFITTFFITALYITSTINNSKYNAILTKIRDIDDELELSEKSYKKTTHQINTFCSSLLVSLLVLLIEPMINLFRSYRIEYPAEFYVLLILPLYLQIAYALNFNTCVQLLEVRFEKVNNSLDKLKLVAEAPEILVKLRHCCELHLRLCDVASIINDVFGVALMANIAVICTHFLGNSFMVLYAFKKAKDVAYILPNMLMSMSYMAPAGIMLWGMCYRCDQAWYQYVRCGKLLHIIKSTHGKHINVNILQEIQIFSLQILHEDVKFTAGGFFTVNYSLCFAVIGGLTTYLIILIQFSE